MISELAEKETIKNDAKTGKIAGIDFGLKTFLTLSNHETIESPEFFKKSSKKIAECHKKLSRKQLKSKNREKARKTLARIYKRLENLRNDFFFIKAHELLKKYDWLFFNTMCVYILFDVDREARYKRFPPSSPCDGNHSGGPRVFIFPDIVELLISKGADINAKTSLGQTPLELALPRRNTASINVLRKHGAEE